MKSVKLHNGIELPFLAYGTYQIDNADSVRQALEAGYRYFDTAAFYGNERQVGAAIRESGLPREEIMVATKLWKTDMGYDNALRQFERSCDAIGLGYVDVYLIHWPNPDESEESWKQLDIETWRALEELYHAGRVRAIGVSNFLPHHIENLIQNCEIVPMLDQLELHPGYLQPYAVEYCREKGIAVQGWRPLAKGVIGEEPLLCALAEKYGTTSAKIALTALAQLGIIPLPRSSSPARMRDNMDLWSFALSAEDLMKIQSMPPFGWSGEHPDRPRIVR